MNTLDTNVPNGRMGTRAEVEPQQLRAALVSPNDELRRIVLESMHGAGLPMRVELEITDPTLPLSPGDLEGLGSIEPDVVILDMGDDPEEAIRAATMIATANPRAALVGLGPTLEASTLLEAMRAGVVEYVPRPVETTSLRDSLERVMRKRGWSPSQGGRRNGELLAFFSPKGGSGSTTVVTNIGIELHRLTGKKTLLVDLDLELGEIASLLGIRPRFHFVDLVRNFHRMDADLLASYIESHESGVQVLSAPFEPEIGEEVTGEQIARILGFLRNHYDYVLVDVSKSLAPPALAALQAADPIFLVTNMDVPSLRNMKRCLPILDRVTAGDAERLRLVVNRYNSKSLVGLDDLEETLGIEVYWTLTNDYGTVINSISAGEPLVLQGSSRYADELKALARDISTGAAGETRSERSFVAKLLWPFGSRSPGSPSKSDARQETGSKVKSNSGSKSSPVEVPSHG